MHETLIQQIIQHFGSLDRVPDEIRPFLAAIDRTYQESQVSAIAQAALQKSAGDPLPKVEVRDDRQANGGKRGNGQSTNSVAIPIQLRGQTLGAINLSFDDRSAARNTAPLVEQLSSRLALAMDNARLFRETQESLARTNALLEVSRAAIAFESTTSLLENAAEIIARTLNTDRVVIRRIDAATEQILEAAGAGPGIHHSPLDTPFKDLMEGLHGWVLRERQPAMIAKDRPDPREGQKSRNLRLLSNSGAMLVVPLQTRSTVTGMITAVNTLQQADFTEQDAGLLSAMANQLSTALENSLLVEDQQRRLQELSVLFEGSRIFSTAPLEPVDAAAVIARYFLDISGANRSAVGLYRAQDEFVSFLAEINNNLGIISETEDPSIWNYALNDYPFTRQVMQTRLAASVSLSDPEIDPAEKKYLLENNEKALVIIPMASKGQPVGLIELEYFDEDRKFDQEELNYFTTLANQAATTLDNLQLLRAQGQRALELQTASEVSQAASSVLDPDELLPLTVELIRDRFDLYYAGIFLVDDSGEWAVLRAGSGEAGRIQIEQGHRLEVGGQSMIGRCVATGEAQIALDVGETAARFQNPVLPETRSEMALPLISRGRQTGAMTIQSSKPAAFSEENITTLQTMADQLANAIENARLYAQAQLQNQELDTLNEMGRALTASLDRGSIAENIHKYTAQLMGFDSFLLVFYNRDQSTMSFPLVVEKGERISIPDQPLGSGLVAHIIRNRMPLLIPDRLEETTRALGIQFTTVGEAPQSWLGVPMFIGDEVIGVVSVQTTTTPRLYTERNRDLLISISNQASNALQIAALFEQARQQATDLSVLNEMSRALSIQLNINEVVEIIYRNSAQLLQTPNLFIALYDQDTQIIDFKLAVTDDKTRLRVPARKLGNGLTDYVIHSRTPLLFKENADVEIQRMGLEGITIGDPPLSWLAVPIILGSAVIGVIGTQSVTTPGKYTERHRDLLISIAGQAAIALQNASLFHQAQQQSEDLTVLNDMSRDLSTLLDVEQIVEKVYQYASRLIDNRNIFIALYNDETRQIRFPYVVDDGKKIEVPDRLLGNGLTDHVIRTQTALVINESPDAVISELGLQAVTIGEAPESWMGIPIVLGARSLGMIGSQSVRTARRYSRRHIDLVTSIAGQAAITLQNAALFGQTQRQNRDLAVLNEMSRVLSATMSMSDVVEIVYEYASRLLDTSLFHMIFYDEDAQTIRYPLVVNNGRRLDVPSRPYGNNSLTEYVIKSRQSVLLEENVPEEMEKLGLEPVLLGDPDVPLCWMGVPMSIGPQVIGVLALQSTTTPRLFGPYERDLLTSIAGQAAIAIQNARLFGETQKRAAQLLTAAEIARDATESLNLDELLPRAVELIRDRFGFYHASIFLLDEAGREAYVRASTGAAGFELVSRRHRLEVGSKSIIGSVTSTGQSLVVNDVTRDIIHRPNPLLPDTRAELGIPLKIGDRVIGALDVQSDVTNAFSPDDVAVLQTLADQLAIAVDNSRTYTLAQEAFEQARARALEMTSLYDVSRDLTASALETRGVAETALVSISTYLGENVTCSISVLDEETGMMHIIADQRIGEAGREFHEDPSVWNFNLDDYPATRKVLETRQPAQFRVDDPESEAAEREYMQNAGSHALLIVPLTVKGSAIGVLEAENWQEGAQFTAEQVNLVTAMANQTAAALENAMLYDEQLRTAEQLRELDKLKNQFLANMSHELRTPLNSIIGFSRVIIKGIDGPTTDLQKQDLNAIYSAGQHLLGLINDILDLSRIEAGKMELNFEDLEIEGLITSVMATARGLVKEKKIMLDQEVDPGLPVIQADGTRIRQVLLNLLQNAAKFTEEGYIRVRVKLEPGENGVNFIKVSVEDTGIGIEPEDNERLFQPFTQVDSSTTRKVGGTGLGLSISRNLIELHGGDIGVVSTPGKGSTFYFTLPVRQSTAAALPEGDRKVVLAIDDDPKVIELYERYLHSQGYEVIAVHDPNLAVQLAVEKQPYRV